MSENRETRKKQRPISPHLSIYKPQINSISSILHRLSGVGLFIALSIFCWFFIIWTFNDFDQSCLKLLDNILVKTVLFLSVYGFFYHFCTGIRHLVWDMGYGFSINAINYSSWMVFALSVSLTTIFWLLILGAV